MNGFDIYTGSNIFNGIDLAKYIHYLSKSRDLIADRDYRKVLKLLNQYQLLGLIELVDTNSINNLYNKYIFVNQILVIDLLKEKYGFKKWFTINDCKDISIKLHLENSLNYMCKNNLIETKFDKFRFIDTNITDLEVKILEMCLKKNYTSQKNTFIWRTITPFLNRNEYKFKIDNRMVLPCYSVLMKMVKKGLLKEVFSGLRSARSQREFYIDRIIIEKRLNT